MPVLRGEEPEGGRDGGTEVTYRRIRRKVAQKESYNVSYFAGIKKPFGCFACSKCSFTNGDDDELRPGTLLNPNKFKNHKCTNRISFQFKIVV